MTQVKGAQHRGACTEATAPACQYLGSFNSSKLTGQPDVERGAVVTGGGREGQGGAGGGGSGEGVCKAMEGEALEGLISDVDARKKLAASQGVCVCARACACKCDCVTSRGQPGKHTYAHARTHTHKYAGGMRASCWRAVPPAVSRYPQKKVKIQGVCAVKTQINVYHLKTKEHGLEL